MVVLLLRCHAARAHCWCAHLHIWWTKDMTGSQKKFAVAGVMHPKRVAPEKNRRFQRGSRNWSGSTAARSNPVESLRGVNRVVLIVRRSLPVYLDKQTFSVSIGMSQRWPEAAYGRLVRTAHRLFGQPRFPKTPNKQLCVFGARAISADIVKAGSNGPDCPEIRLPLFPQKRTQVGHAPCPVRANRRHRRRDLI
jgi:hypothetical protein